MDVESLFPYADISDDLGELKTIQKLCDDVYYVSVTDDATGLPNEYYVFPMDTNVLSQQAKTYAAPLPSHPELGAVIMGATGSGSTVIHYEGIRYKLLHSVPLDDGEDIRAVAVYGMEDHPEYFGRFPAPMDTPQGSVLRYQELANGIFVLETENCSHIIAAAYPIWVGDLSTYVQRCGRTMPAISEDRPYYGYLFFDEEFGSLALFELMQTHELSGDIVYEPAVKNHIFLNHPEYAIHHNRREGLGINDRSELLREIFGVELDPQEPNLIAWNPDAGTNYLQM